VTWPASAICKLLNICKLLHTFCTGTRPPSRLVSGKNCFLLQPVCCSCGDNLWRNPASATCCIETKLVSSPSAAAGLKDLRRSRG